MVMFGRGCSAIAVDAGPASIALCQLTRSGRRLRIHHCGLYEAPLRERPESKQSAVRIAERATRLIRQGSFRGTAAQLALQPPDISFHVAAIPAQMHGASRGQWQTMVRCEAARQLQCEPDELEADYWFLPPGNRSGCNVMIAAVRLHVLNEKRAFCAGAGLRLKRVDALPLALVRAAVRAGVPEKPPPTDAIWGILDMGFRGALLTVVLGAQCVYVRSLATGGDAITTAVQEVLEIDYRTAETLKRQHAASGASGAADEMLHAVVRRKTRELGRELRRAYTYAMENYPDASPTGLYLTGGGARLAGLPEGLSAVLGIPVQRLNPLAELQTTGVAGNLERGADDPGMAACVGLALGDVL